MLQLANFWASFILKNRIIIVSFMCLITVFCIIYLKFNLRINTNTYDMLSDKIAWRALDKEYDQHFPQYHDNIIVAIKATTPDQAQDAAIRIHQRLKNSELFETADYLADIDYIKNSAFLLISTEELQDLSDNLAKIQPFLGRLFNQYNLIGLSDMLQNAIDAKLSGEVIDLDPLLKELNHSLADPTYMMSWQKIMHSNTQEKPYYYELIYLKHKPNYEQLFPAQSLVTSLQALRNDIATEINDVDINLTGSIMLAHEELKSVANANLIAIFASIMFVTIILLIAFRSWRIMFAALFTLSCGLIYTTTFAIITIQQLNLISIVFAVLYIGLGIDFVIHWILYYQEHHEDSTYNMLQHTLKNTTRSLCLCAVTTAIGFYAFIPTDYKGVAELGFISGSGMIISLITTLTLLAALMTWLPKPKGHTYKNKTIEQILNLPYQYPKQCIAITVIILLPILLNMHKLQFDNNQLNLQDPNNESVMTYQALLAEPELSPWHGVMITNDPTQAKKLSQQLSQLSTVKEVIWLDNFIPNEQEEKLEIIDELNLLLGQLPQDINLKQADPDQQQLALTKLYQQLEQYNDEQLDPHIKQFKTQLHKLLNNNTPEQINAIEYRLLSSLKGRINTLNQALNADSVDINDIPKDLKSYWQNNKTYRLQINPQHNLNDPLAMAKFVEQLKSIDERIIGNAVINVEAGHAVLNAFQQALIYAFVAVFILLLYLMPKKTDILIIMTCLIITTLFTIGILLLFNISFNFANIIVLPLLVGISVDSSIHLSHRFHHTKQINTLATNSTSRGVIYSNLTTFFSVCNLAFSLHQGTASIGFMLSIGLLANLIISITILPSLLILINKKPLLTN